MDEAWQAQQQDTELCPIIGDLYTDDNKWLQKANVSRTIGAEMEW